MAEPIHSVGLPKKHYLTDKHLEDVILASLADGDVLTWEAATSKWKNKPPTLDYYQAIGTTDASTTSTTYVDIPGMTLTVPAEKDGTYLIIFSINVYCPKVAGETRNLCCRILKDSTIVVQGSLLEDTANASIINSGGQQRITTLTAGQVVKAQWRFYSNPSPVRTMYNNPATEPLFYWRNLMLIKLA